MSWQKNKLRQNSCLHIDSSFIRRAHSLPRMRWSTFSMLLRQKWWCDTGSAYMINWGWEVRGANVLFAFIGWGGLQIGPNAADGTDGGGQVDSSRINVHVCRCVGSLAGNIADKRWQAQTCGQTRRTKHWVRLTDCDCERSSDSFIRSGTKFTAGCWF